MTRMNQLHYCNYTGYCPYQCLDCEGTPALLPAPAYKAALALEVGSPRYGRAINQLQELAQHGYIDFPKYEFFETYDSKKHPTWHCQCTLRGWDGSTASFPTKRLAKHAVAFEMLCRVLAF